MSREVALRLSLFVKTAVTEHEYVCDASRLVYACDLGEAPAALGIMG